MARHRLDQARRDVTRIGVHDADPRDVRRGGNNGVEQLRHAIFHAHIRAVIAGVLRDQDDLFDAHRFEAHRLSDNRLQWAADHRAFDLGDGAKGTGAAAAIGDLEVGARALHAGTEHAALVQADDFRLVRQVIEWFGMLTDAQSRHEVEDIHPAARADHAVESRHFLYQVRAVALRQAARRDHHLPAAAAVHQLAQHINRLLFGGVDEAAGIDDQHLGLVLVGDADHAVLVKYLRHALGIDRVLGAAEADQIVFVFA